MLTIKGPSNKPCFICGSKERTTEVRFADGTFRGVLCVNHVYEKLMPAKEQTDAQSERSRKPA
jgi:hypothetical protein